MGSAWNTESGIVQVAVQAGRVDKVQCLLEIGADSKATDLNGNTFFHIAARDGKAEVVKAFINDVDLTNVNKDGDTSLHLAAKSGDVEAVRLLVNKSKLDTRNKLVISLLEFLNENDWNGSRTSQTTCSGH